MAITKMEDLKNSMCRWPYGDPRNKKKFHFCGDRRDGESSYCRKHEVMARRSSETSAKTDNKKAA